MLMNHRTDEVHMELIATQYVCKEQTDSLLSMLRGALSARTRADWLQWLHGGLQRILPHHALIVAWGDFNTGLVAYEVLTAHPEVSASQLPRDVIEPLVQTLHGQWLTGGREPVAIDSRLLRSVGSSFFNHSPYALVHGVQDHRSGYDCIYALVGPAGLADPDAEQMVQVALPFIDTGFRQLADCSQKLTQAKTWHTGPSGGSYSDGFVVNTVPVEADRTIPHTPVRDEPVWGDVEPGERGSALSARELEVMEWVRMGKTNSEIAMILNLSTFTVKNHMRRIYKKLDVLNRAQAVGSLDRMRRAPQPAVC
jgi:transcriptional regulator EpsA